jgi:hypothetical protein
MDSRSRLNDGPARAPESLSADREERLLRFVDILRAEQVRASIKANAEGGRTGVRRWRGFAPFLVIVFIAIGVAAAFLKAPGLSFVGPDATRDSAAGTASVQGSVPAPSSQSALPPEIAHSRAPEGVPDADAPAGGPANLNPTSPVAGVLSSDNARPPGSAPAKQGAADSPNLPTAPPATVVARPDTIEPLVPGHDADAIAAPPPVWAEPEVSELETGKPILLVYYPHRSRRGEATAQNLAALIGSEVRSSDIEAPASLPDNAMIKFSDERNHKLARMIGKSLGDSGYRWRIEKVPSPAGSHRNVIEVWLPMK